MSCSITSCSITSPVGPWIARACRKGIHGLKLAPQVDNDNFLRLGQDSIDIVDKESNLHLNQLCNWMKGYFSAEEERNPTLPKIAICPTVFGDDSDTLTPSFRQKVWKTLFQKVSFGQTISYGELAALCQSPGASRAVGSAMANNPVSLVIPCHRVVKSDGKPGNYSKSTKNNVKIWLLDHEKQD